MFNTLSFSNEEWFPISSCQLAPFWHQCLDMTFLICLLHSHLGSGNIYFWFLGHHQQNNLKEI